MYDNLLNTLDWDELQNDSDEIITKSSNNIDFDDNDPSPELICSYSNTHPSFMIGFYNYYNDIRGQK